MSSVDELEQAAAATWSPDERACIAGWTLVSNGGFTRRANCATPTAAGATDPDVRAAVSNWLAERGAPLVVRITPLVDPVVESLAATSWGLAFTDDTVVMTKALKGARPGRSLQVDPAAADFAARLLDLNGRPRGAIAPWTRMVMRLGEDVTGVQAEKKAVGLVAVANGHAAIYSVAVAAAHRRQGRASDIMATAEAWAFERGAHTAFLQVRGDNEPARIMYERLGYEERYRYHYLAPRPTSA